MGYDPYGGAYGADPRDGITRALMNVAQPPPVSPGQPMQIPGIEQPPAGGPQQQQPVPVGGVPPVSPPGGPPGAQMQAPMSLPGVMQPGQLPQGMNPAAAAGIQPLPMPPRSY